MTGTIILCDFDGTITETDNIIALMKQFAPKEWIALKDRVLSQELSIQEGVGEMFRLIPSSKKEDMLAFLREHAVIREGFREFVSWTKEKGIPFYVVSGGMDFFVYDLLKPYGPFSGVYCNEADFSGSHVEVKWPHSCDDQCDSQQCGCCKPAIMRSLLQEHPDVRTIVIGDSVTDLRAAREADFVLARDYLLTTCREENLHHAAFETFYECRSAIETELEVTVR